MVFAIILVQLRFGFTRLQLIRLTAYLLGRLLERQIPEVMCLVEVISSASFALGLVIWIGPSVAEVIDQEADE